MKQLNLFNHQTNDQQETRYWKLFVDGASRNNPGPASAGICITCNEAVVKKNGCYLGLKTNNQAEYLALLFGLYTLKKMVNHQDLVVIISDSQLLVRQLQGSYKVKESHLKPLFALAKKEMHSLNYSLAHVLREENKEADAQANDALDKKKKPPEDFMSLLHDHDIVL